MNASGRLARAISWIGHPLVFVTWSVGVVVALRLANRVGIAVLLALLLSVIFPTAILLFRGVRSGHWSDADVSVRTERNRFYPMAIPISALGVGMLWFLHAPAFMARGAFVTLGLLVVAAIANFRIKLSLHALFAFYCTVILFRVQPAFGAAALALALLVFWSRLYLQRHDVPEMLTGALLGMAGGVVTAWWP
ncbi:MAG TPA: phosphatase PAP2 family protein [Chthoniobacterales bacterium]|nr:phosphatase PAP2 family protein [Chthoniobacterales bacterium]